MIDNSNPELKLRENRAEESGFLTSSDEIISFLRDMPSNIEYHKCIAEYIIYLNEGINRGDMVSLDTLKIIELLSLDTLKIIELLKKYNIEIVWKLYSEPYGSEAIEKPIFKITN